MENHSSAIEKILDSNNSDNIVLYKSNGDAIEFRQVALIPIEEALYVILTEDTEENGDLVVFLIGKDKSGRECLKRVLDDEITDTVLSVYEALCDADEEDVTNE